MQYRARQCRSPTQRVAAVAPACGWSLRRSVDAAPRKSYVVLRVMSELQNSLLELVRRTSAEIPDDVQKAILDSLELEKKGTIAESALKIIERNIGMARQKSQPICQDTGSILL